MIQSFPLETQIRAGLRKPRERLGEKPIVKIYWRIAEVSRELGVANSAIRYWEREFDLTSTRKGGRGDRVYTRKEVDLLRLIAKAVSYLHAPIVKQLLKEGRLEKIVFELEGGNL